MSIEEQRKANREKFPDFTQFTDSGFKLLWAKHIDGTEVGRDVSPHNDLVTISAECAIALSTFGMKK